MSELDGEKRRAKGRGFAIRSIRNMRGASLSMSIARMYQTGTST